MKQPTLSWKILVPENLGAGKTLERKVVAAEITKPGNFSVGRFWCWAILVDFLAADGFGRYVLKSLVKSVNFPN